MCGASYGSNFSIKREFKMAKTNAPKGFVATSFRAKDGKIIVKDSVTKKDVTLNNPVLHVPVTTEAIAAACKDYSFVVVDTDGKEHVLKGVEAAAVAKYWHGAESVIGLARGKNTKKGIISGLPAAEVVARLAQLCKLGGSQSGGSKTIAEDELDGMSAEEIKAFLRTRGFVAQKAGA